VVKFLSLGLVLLTVALASTQAASPAPVAAVVKVSIMPNLRIVFAPTTVRHGPVVFKVKNASYGQHQFSINGVTTKYIPIAGTVSIKVTLKRPAVYTATLADCGYLSRCAGGDLPSGNIRVT
jgi:hypothetical protein